MLLVAGCLVLALGATALAEYGTAFIARGRLQRIADLAAVAAAKRMSDDYARLFAPVRLRSGQPNPEWLPVSEYRRRARAAAARAVVGASRPTTRLVAVELAPASAPTRATVTIGASQRVRLPTGDDDASTLTLRARASARLWFALGAMPSPRPADATRGGYSGPLAYRQGKPMRPDVASAFDLLYAAAYRDGHSLVIASAFRSDAEQARLFARRPDPKWVAPPGTSLHRYATELDLGPPSAYGWLAANARRFGFIKRYAWEDWHFGFGRNPRDVPAQYERGSYEPAHGRFDGEDGLPAYVPIRFASMVADAAQRWDVQPELLAAQLQAESGFNPNAVSPAGAQGIAQFMPATAHAVGLRDPFDPRQAINAQAKLMSSLIRRFGSIQLALAAYNAGPGAVERYGGLPPFAETRAYVARILLLMKGSGAGMNDPAFAGIAVSPRVVLIE